MNQETRGCWGTCFCCKPHTVLRWCFFLSGKPYRAWRTNSIRLLSAWCSADACGRPCGAGTRSCMWDTCNGDPGKKNGLLIHSSPETRREKEMASGAMTAIAVPISTGKGEKAPLVSAQPLSQLPVAQAHPWSVDTVTAFLALPAVQELQVRQEAGSKGPGGGGWKVHDAERQYCLAVYTSDCSSPCIWL